MTSKDIRKKVKIGKKNYDVIYRSQITGNLGTYEELKKGKFHDEDLQLTPKMVEPVVLRERSSKHDRRLVIDPDGWNRERCPWCFYVKITEHSNKRETWELGNPYIVLSSKVDFGSPRKPRRRETSKYCESCERTFVKEKVIIARYG